MKLKVYGFLFLFISGCITDENKAQDNAANLAGDQLIALKNSVVQRTIGNQAVSKMIKLELYRLNS